MIFGGKTIENRTWHPSRPMRLLVHAGLSFDEEALDVLAKKGVKYNEGMRIHGAIIGAVDVISWGVRTRSKWAVPGYWHWKLVSPVPAAPPIYQITGRASLFRPPVGWERHFPAMER